MSVEQTLACPNYIYKRKHRTIQYGVSFFVVFPSWHTVSGFPVKAASLLIPRAITACPAARFMHYIFCGVSSFCSRIYFSAMC